MKTIALLTLSLLFGFSAAQANCGGCEAKKEAKKECSDANCKDEAKKEKCGDKCDEKKEGAKAEQPKP